MTLFVALSDKGMPSFSPGEYLSKIRPVIAELATNPLFEFGVHTHCRGLPMDFATEHDELSAYAAREAEHIVAWCQRQIAELTGTLPRVHRAANYSICRDELRWFGDMLHRYGIEIDSSDITVEYSRATRMGGVWELPPTTTSALGARHKVWSPDTMDAETMLALAAEAGNHTSTLVSNAHSFLFEEAGLYRPDSPTLKAWFSLPPAVQQFLRPGVRVVKRGVQRRGARPLIDPGAVEQPALQTLRSVVSSLRSQGCEFLPLSACAGLASQDGS